jgi:hypothetical protein
VATHFGWIRDIFLPTPERIVTSFADAWKGDIQGGRPLLDHFWASLMRVFAAFLLAASRRFRRASQWASRASRAASSIRRSSSTGRCRRLRTCR